ncbi:hypothetical protein ACFSL4_01760 [Streptomyces caeni]|uniref:Uncharacterized protein n=1 Tax=Streptomyces caeni TaxID=2307231 RepID=A0ABW4IK25_9ACTN
MRMGLYHKSKSVIALASSTRTDGTVNGTTVDRYQATAGEYRTVLFVVTTGTITDGSHAFAVQESDDDTTWTAAAADAVQGTAPTITNTDSDAVFDVGYVGVKRYARIVAVTTGATSGGVFSGAAVLYGTRRDR